MVKVTIGSTEYDSYITVADADVYLAADVARAAAWAAKNDDAKGRGLASATRKMVGLPWCDGVPGFDNAPDPVPQITAELACDMLGKPALAADASGSSNIKSVKAGSAQVEFFSPVEAAAPLPQGMWNSLLAANLICPGESADSAGNGAPFVSGICGGPRPLSGRYPWDWPIAEQDYD